MPLPPQCCATFNDCCSCLRMQVGDVVIVHTHGPKPELSL